MNILIVDDHSLIREGIATMIRNVLPNARIEQADSCEGALVAARHQVFDLVFLDLMLPDQPGMVALKRLREGYPALPVVIVSGQEDKATVMQALDLGAKSFVPKSADSTKVRLAIETVLDGRIYLPESTVGAAVAAARIEGALPWALTDRQVDVLALLISGLPNKLIARRLGIVESTVKIHVSAILRELKVASRTQAIIAVSKAGVRLTQPA